jgi:hypothetical protein
MKTRLTLNVFFLLCLTLCFSLACKKKDKCEGIVCSNGNECLDGKCGCPEGTVKVGRACLTPWKESYYCTSPCFCIDTFLLSIGKYTSKGDSTLRDITISSKKGGFTDTDGWYYPSPDGDSLYTLFAITPVNDDPFVCKIQGHNLAPYFAGKVVNKTELKGKLYWWNPAANGVDLRDSCEVTMRKL